MGKNLHSKIVKIMNEIQYIQKDMKVSFGRTNYSALSEEKVTSIIRQKLVDHQLTIMPVSQTYEKLGDIFILNVTYQITDAESGEFIQVVSAGEGKDGSDKGAGKASTYAYKYALLRTFAIPTGNDPDAISTEEHTYNEQEQKNQILSRIGGQLNNLLNRGYTIEQINSGVTNFTGVNLNLSDASINAQHISVLNKVSEFLSYA